VIGCMKRHLRRELGPATVRFHLLRNVYVTSMITDSLALDQAGIEFVLKCVLYVNGLKP